MMFKKITNGFNSVIFSNRYFVIGLILIALIILVFNISLYYTTVNYNNRYQEEELLESMEMLNFILEERMTYLSGYAIAISSFRDLLNLGEDKLLQRRIVNLHTKLGIKGIKVYDNNLNVIYNTGSNFEIIKGTPLSENIIQVIKEGYNVSFFSENDFFELQLNAVSPIYDKYSIDISGLVIVSDVINKEYLQTIVKNTNGIIQFFKIDNFPENGDDLFINAKYYPGKGYYIKDEDINGMDYLIGYLPVKDFYSNIIGYFTILKPQSNNIITYKLVILNLVYSLFLLGFMYYIYPKLFK